MIKPHGFIDEWFKKTGVNDVLEALRYELLEPDANEYFDVEVSKV